MTRHVFIFLGTFVLGAFIALAARTASHQPHAEHVVTTHQTPATPAVTTASNTVTDPHAAHRATPAGKPVNTLCAICGMDVDPTLPTMEYKGKTIGFGCKMCPPKFKAEPDKYGPFYLRNEVIKR